MYKNIVITFIRIIIIFRDNCNHNKPNNPNYNSNNHPNYNLKNRNNNPNYNLNNRNNNPNYNPRERVGFTIESRQVDEQRNTATGLLLINMMMITTIIMITTITNFSKFNFNFSKLYFQSMSVQCSARDRAVEHLRSGCHLIIISDDYDLLVMMMIIVIIIIMLIMIMIMLMI